MCLISKTLIVARAASLGVFLAVFIGDVSQAAPVEATFVSKAPQVLLVDDRSGTVLYSKNANVPIPPASLAKLMTAEVVFDALEKGGTTLETPYIVSENAWRTGGAPSGTSTMFARIKSTPTVGDLLQGMIVQSANDGAIVLAEGLAGSEEAFVKRMNARAQELGLTGSKFVNATGLPARGQVVSLQDLVKLAQHIREAHPEYYKYYSQPTFTWNNITQRNRNPLLRLDVGADGMGTGFTEASGFSLVGSAEQNGRRLYLAMSGLSSTKEREEEAKRLLQWGMSAFDDVQLFPANAVVGEAHVFGGAQAYVPLKVKDRVELLLPKEGRDKLKGRLVYKGPLDAPLAGDQQVGVLELELNGSIIRNVPVFTAQSVDSGSLSKRALGGVMELSTGWLRKYL